VIEIREVLRLWLAGHSLREVTRLAGLDRKTVRRYVQATEAAGVSRGGGDGQLTEELLGAVVGVVRPDRPRGNGASWEAIAGQREQIAMWLKQDLTLAKIHMLLGRRGVVVPYRTLHRFAVAEFGFGRRQPTVRVADGKPGQEVQVDFGRLGLLPEPATGRRRVAQGLIFTAVYSRHMFVYPTLRQTLEDVVAGFEAAWVFFGGVFAIVVTLLILELKVPILHDRGSANELGHRLVGLLPKFELAHQLHHWLQILAESSSPRKR